eukprot:gene1147-2216_t
MGLTLGRAPLPQGCKRFLNLPRSCIYDLWEAFNDIAEGFGLTIDEFQEILKSSLMEHLAITERTLNIDTEKVFRIYDDDENNLVDSLEFLSSFALLSGMTPEEKIKFIFAMYDFDESSVLTLDEMVLAFRSTLSGLTKLSKIDPPTEAEVEAIVVQGFETVRKSKTSDVDIGFDSYLGIDSETFLSFCTNTPEIMSWIEFFDDLEEAEEEQGVNELVAEKSLNHMEREVKHDAVMNASRGGFGRLQWERKGLAKDCMPRQNWQNVIPFVTPARMPDQSREVPPHNIKLDWVYGFNAHTSRQNLFYTSKGTVVYPAGAVCVILNVQQGTQQHFIEHSDLVTCMRLSHNFQGQGTTLVASGECGLKPAIHVWDCDTRIVLATLQGFHRRGILSLDFSPDGTRLATVGMDPYHSVAVYNWMNGERLWASRTTSSPVYDLGFLTNGLVATCGKDHILFWKEDKTIQANIFKRYRGLFGSAVKVESLWSVAMLGERVVTGSESGMLHLWEGRNWIKSIKGHTGTIFALHVVNHDNASEKGLVSACSSGKIQVWNSKLEIGATFNAASLGPVEPAITAVCWDVVGSKMLLGFRTCEIFEMDSTDGRSLHKSSILSAHFTPRVCGIDTHPTNPRQFCTVGSDKTVRVFDAHSHKLVKMAILDTMASSCSYSPDGQLIMVGFGSGVVGKEERKEGAFVVLNEEDLTVVHEARDSKGLISDCKFSPDGELIALASIDGSIYIYNASDYAAKCRCRGHTGKVTHIDFSQDSQFIISNCSAGDLMFWDAHRGDMQTAKLMREILWNSHTCVFSYVSQGIWGPYPDGVECNAVAASHARDLLVSVDNYGRLRSFTFPCIREDSNYITMKGHGANVLNCRFSCEDSYLYTTGGSDGCVLQWRITVPETQNYDDLKKDDATYDQLNVEMKLEGKALDRRSICEDVMNDRPTAQCQIEEGEVEVNNTAQWQRSIVAPSRLPPEDPSEPSDFLELDFVNGFAADRSREAVKYTRNGEIVFFVASIAVVMSQKDRKQRFYSDHSNSITALSVHPLDTLVATGQLGEVPYIRIWNSLNMATVTTLEGFHRRGIAHLCFSKNGRTLATVGLDRFHSVAVYDWRNQHILSSTQSFSNKALFCCFTPSSEGLLQAGKEVLRFWELDGQNLRFQDALLSSRAKLQSFLSVGWIGNSAVVGTADGNIYRFIGRQLDGIVQAHAGNVNAISSTNDGVCTGGSDGYVKIWNRTLDCRMVIDVKTWNSVVPNVRCVDWDSDSGRIIIGTISSELYEVGAADGEGLHKGPLLEGHSGDELWGLAVHPVKDVYCTVGDDCMLKVWDVFDHRVTAQIALEMPSRCCCYSPDGKHLAVGFGSPKRVSARQYDGKWVIYDTEDFQVIHEARDSNKWISEIKYSPNGNLLAMGSFDNKIYVYNIPGGYSLSAMISQHSSFITHLDFSEDSGWLQSNCAGYELCFFEADTGMFIPAASRLRDVRWDSQTCTLGWPVQGAWPPQRDSTEITTVDCNLFRGGENVIVATGDNYGRVQLFRYPATSSFAISKRYRAAASPISRLKFVSGDSYLVSLVAVDKAIMQWAHKRDRGENVAWNVAERRSDVEEEEDDVMRLFGLVGGTEGLPDIADLKKFITSRPWVASVVVPSDPPTPNPAAPNNLMQLAHIFGLQCDITRGSVRYNTSGDLVFPSSRYVCVYNKKSNCQTIYSQHTAEISCVCVTRDGSLVASVEKTKRPVIHIWDSSTCVNIIELPLLHRKGVVSMQFSTDKKMLVSVGQDQDHSIAIWESITSDWTDGRLKAWSKGDVNPVLFCSFYSEAGYVLASGGRSHQKFWRVDGRCLNASYPEHEASQQLGTLLCGCSVDKVFVSGSTSGQLHVWRGRRLDRVIRAHELGVTAIWSSDAGVVTAAKDGIIKLWSPRLEHIRTFSLGDADVPPILGCVRAVDAMASTKGDSVIRILVATASGEVYEVAAKSGSTCIMTEAHYCNELWGVGMHPSNADLFVTSGDDHTVRVWSISKRRMLRKAILDCTARCVSWSPDGKNIIVGMGGSWDGKRQRKDGAFVILDAATLKPVFEGRDSRHWIQDAKFSPDGKVFATASMDHKIYLYNRENYRLRGTCSRHNSFVRGFDFSADGEYLQSDAGDYEHLYFESLDGEHFAAGSQLRDVEWADWTCCFGWPVQGAWPRMEDVARGTAVEPSCVHRSSDNKLLAVGYLDGTIKLFRYPCIAKDATSVEIGAHVKEVSKLRFTCDDKFIVSLGKYDRAVSVWRVTTDGLEPDIAVSITVSAASESKMPSPTKSQSTGTPGGSQKGAKSTKARK